MIRRLAHLCFVTDNVPGMIDFYQRLGLQVKFTMKNQDGQTFGYYFEIGDSSFLEIFDRVLMHKQWGGELQERVAGTQYRHFCLEVTALADLQVKLEAKGITLTAIKQGLDRSRQAWTKDPDGNAIELMEYTSESKQLQPAERR